RTHHDLCREVEMNPRNPGSEATGDPYLKKPKFREHDRRVASPTNDRFFGLPGRRAADGEPASMMRISKDPRLLLPACASGLLGVGAAHAPAAAREVPDQPPSAARTIDYARDVKPLFEARCYGCHGPKKQKSGLRLDEKAAALQGSSDGVKA